MISSALLFVLALTAQLAPPALSGPPSGSVDRDVMTIFEADLLTVGQEPFEALGVAPGELVDLMLPAGPEGTGTSFPEPIQYQLGSQYDPTGRPQPMLVAYHGFGSSSKSVAVQSTLDEICNQRGWIFLSVTGLDDKLFGTEFSQQHTETAIHWMLEHFNVDPDRISMVGFSMGAGVTMNFAARHRDPDGIMLAAIGLVSAAADWTSSWTNGTPSVKSILENPLNFGATPAQDAFAYRRWSGTYHAPGSPIEIGVLQPQESMASNLGSTPVYLTWDNGDTTLYITDQCAKLAAFLPTLGGEVTVKTVFGTLDPDTGIPAPHSWAVLKEAQLMNFLDGRLADRRPARVHAVLAENATVAGATVVQRQPGAFSALDIEVNANSQAKSEIKVTGVHNAQSVVLDAGGTAERRLQAAPDDGMAFDLQVGGFDTRPSYILQSGSGALVHDVRSLPLSNALEVSIPSEGLQAAMVSRPDWNATLTISPDPAAPGLPVEIRVDGPPGASTAWLVFSNEEALTPVLGSAATLGLLPRPPAFIRQVPVDVMGDVSLSPLFPPAVAPPGGHVHVQALFLEASLGPVATSNVWMLRWQ